MKRFYREVAVEESGGGWRITLDGRAIKTAVGAPQIVPTRPLAEALAAEWAAQGDEIDPRGFAMRRPFGRERVGQRAGGDDLWHTPRGLDLTPVEGDAPAALTSLDRYVAVEALHSFGLRQRRTRNSGTTKNSINPTPMSTYPAAGVNPITSRRARMPRRIISAPVKRTATIEKLFGVKSFDKALEVQSEYAKSAYEGFVAEATKIGELYADFAKEAYKPFETALARAK